MTEKIQKFDMRAAMPRTAAWVNERRAEHGATWVNGCIKKAMAGERGWFYAVESGHVLGQPFDWPATHGAMINAALMTGAPFFAALRPPG